MTAPITPEEILLEEPQAMRISQDTLARGPWRQVAHRQVLARRTIAPEMSLRWANFSTERTILVQRAEHL